MNILVLESSTTSAKAMLYDTVTGTYEVKINTYTLCNNDTTIHDAENIFNETVALGRKLCKGKKIDIVSLGGAWHSVMLCDMAMKPKTPVYLWSYTGASDLCKELREDKDYVKSFYQKTGCMVNGIYPAFKLMLLKEKGYDLNDYLIAGQGTYNMFRLTGERVITDSMASGTGLLNTHTKEFDIEILDEIGIKESQLSRLVTYKDTILLSKEGSYHLGIDEGTPVIPTGPDGGLNQVGAGALGDGVMTFSIGTSGAMRLTTDSPIIPEEPSTWCYMSPKKWLSGAATSGCCNCIDWFKEKMFSPDTSYEDIEKGFGDIETTPVFLPFLFGERCPGWQDDRNAAFFDIKPFHTAHDMYHAIMEGTLFNLYQCYQVLTNINGIPKKIKLSGGILNSPYWTQMCVDIFETDMEIDNLEHSSLLGGVALGMEHLGIIKDVTEFTAESAKVIHHNPKMNQLYKKKYERYKYWYDKVI
ncbi:hypothetical protein GC105_06370 [Alkalibaculum sp. M08DMB]|uniref:Gluconokinase n=1 Tax=Alkalibaculum sporogenes TaxID=2655001 RepID=A0A6A7K7E3_9FIRM|nr:FGGY family carbohydrate kinase [Alkalibaculum sporogenes]MPW25409.1 hypothetical protein [Alkalibaculum sporogenes]